MAFGMKQWLGLVGAGALMVSLLTLPPAALDVPVRRGTPLQAERRLNVLRRDIITTENRLQRMRWADEVIPATLAGEGSVTFGFPDNAVPEQVERVRSRALDEQAGAGNDVALGLFFVDYRDGRYTGAPPGFISDPHFYFGERDGRPYCAAVRPVWRQSGDGRAQLSAVTQDGSYLGVCALVRRFGLPGPAVQAWLAEGGASLAATDRPGGGTVLYFRDMRNTGASRRGLLGIKGYNFSYMLPRIEYDQCFAGSTSGCADIFLHPEMQGYSRSIYFRRATKASVAPAQAAQDHSLFEPADYHAVANLAQEFGRERFLAWWRADGDLEEVFQDAFGVPLGTWNMNRVSGIIEITPPGPGVSGAGLMGGAALLAFASIVASLWARRRRVG